VVHHRSRPTEGLVTTSPRSSAHHSTADDKITASIPQPHLSDCTATFGINKYCYIYMCGTAVVNKMQPYSTYIILIKLPGIAVYSYTLDRIPWSACVFYLILYCPSTLSLRPTNPSISLRIPIYCSFLYCSSCLHNMCPIQFHFLLLI